MLWPGPEDSVRYTERGRGDVACTVLRNRLGLVAFLAVVHGLARVVAAKDVYRVLRAPVGGGLAALLRLGARWDSAVPAALLGAMLQAPSDASELLVSLVGLPGATVLLLALLGLGGTGAL